METEKFINQVKSQNVLGEPLQTCSCSPLTGWYRDGSCRTDLSDEGQHTICCVITEAFLSSAFK